MQVREAPNKELKYLAFDEIVDAFSSGDTEKAFYVLERSIFSGIEKDSIRRELERNCHENQGRKEGKVSTGEVAGKAEGLRDFADSSEVK